MYPDYTHIKNSDKGVSCLFTGPDWLSGISALIGKCSQGSVVCSLPEVC